MDNPFKSLSKTQIYIAVGGATAIGGFLVYRHHKSTGSWNPWSSANAASTQTSGTDPITGLNYSDDSAIDPLTNQQYLAEAEQYGSVAAAEAAVSAFGQSTATGSGIPGNPASPASSGSINTPVGTSVYTSNAAWVQAATAGLTDVGYDGPTISAALGAYVTQTPLTPTQVGYVNTAIAEYGPAPVGNLQVISQPVAKPSPTPVPKPPAPKEEMVKVTNLDLLPLDKAQGKLSSLGLVYDGPRGEAAGTKVNGQTPKAGTEVKKGTVVKLRTEQSLLASKKKK